jgi:ADP-ribose pyrophosphatase
VSAPREPSERVIESRQIYDGAIIRVRAHEVELPDGRRARREIVEHDPVVAIVPLDAEGNVVLVRQYRLAAGDALLEVPAGVVDEGEDLQAAAQRELREETGYRAAKLEKLSEFIVSPGFLTEVVHVYLATGLSEDETDGDEDEDIEVVRMPLGRALALVREGAIRDAKSVIGLLLAAQR